MYSNNYKHKMELLLFVFYTVIKAIQTRTMFVARFYFINYISQIPT